MLIVCMDDKYGIGKDGKLPWYKSEDLKFFKKITSGKSIVVGRKTAESLPTLKGRDVYVLSRENKRGIIGGNYCKPINIDDIRPEMVVCGGGEIYNYVVGNKLVDLAYICRIKGDYGCDTFFPYEEFKRDMTITGICNVDDEYRIEVWREK